MGRDLRALPAAAMSNIGEPPQLRLLASVIPYSQAAKYTKSTAVTNTLCSQQVSCHTAKADEFTGRLRLELSGYRVITCGTQRFHPFHVILVHRILPRTYSEWAPKFN